MRRVSPEEAEVRRFLTEAACDEGVPALSGHKRAHLLGGPGVATATWADAEGLVLHAVLARRRDGAALEYAVAPRLVAAGGDREALRLAWAFARERAGPEELVVWAPRRAQREVLETSGFVAVRRVVAMRTEVVETARGGATAGIGSWHPGRDDVGIVAVNVAAFAGHPEQGELTIGAFRAETARLGTRPADLLVAEGAGGIEGFCWLRRVDRTEGEIYVIAVDPEVAGRGIGRRLVTAAVARLAADPGVRACSLWVEGDNERAIALYRSLGFRAVAENVAYRAQPNR